MQLNLVEAHCLMTQSPSDESGDHITITTLRDEIHQGLWDFPPNTAGLPSCLLTPLQAVILSESPWKNAAFTTRNVG